MQQKSLGKDKGKKSDVDEILASLNERSTKLKEELLKNLEIPSATPIPRELINHYLDKCWYKVLDVKLIDGSKVINSKAKQLMLSYHLDKHKDKEAKEQAEYKFKECNTSKEILIDNKKKINYDDVHLFHYHEHR